MRSWPFWAPSEPATMFRSRSSWCPSTIRVREAFYGLYHAPRNWWQKCVMTMKELGWTQLKGDKCAFILETRRTPRSWFELQGSMLTISSSAATLRRQPSQKVRQLCGRLSDGENGKRKGFAGINIRQNSHYSIFLDQESYTQKWLDEINIDKIQSRSAPLQPSEISELRGALGTMPCRATPSGPQFLAETSLRLSEISRGTVETLYKGNKLIREIKHEAKTGLLFPSWGKPISELCVVAWADASQRNHPDKSSTVGIFTAVAWTSRNHGWRWSAACACLVALRKKFKPLILEKTRMCI